MAEDEFFISQIESAKKGLKVFPAISKERVLKAYRDKEEFEWKSVLYPSSLYWGMCLASHVYSFAERGSYKNITAPGEAKMELGSLLHGVWQMHLLNTPLLPKHLKYPKYVKDVLKNKSRKKMFPEFYICSDKYPISGWADFPCKEGHGLDIADFKTTNVHPDKWDEEKAKLPDNKQLTQIYIYYVILKDWYDRGLGYWDLEPLGIRFCYYNNLAFLHKKVSPEFEYREPADPIKVEKTINLLNEAATQVMRYNNKEEKKCSYSDCEKCKKNA